MKNYSSKSDRVTIAQIYEGKHHITFKPIDPNDGGATRFSRVLTAHIKASAKQRRISVNQWISSAVENGIIAKMKLAAAS